MAGKRNPETISWSHDGKNKDGSDTDPARVGGWEYRSNGTPLFSVPLGWETDGRYSFPIPQLKLAEGDYRGTLHLVTKDGIASEPSNVTEFEIRKVPNAPFDVSVS